MFNQMGIPTENGARHTMFQVPKKLDNTHLMPAITRSESDDTCEQQIEISNENADHTVEPIYIHFTGQVAVEPVTGIEYPAELNGYKFIGCGVRTKYMIVHAYAAGVYLKVGPSLLENIRTDKDIDKLLIDPSHPRVFRIVLNRDVTSAQYIGATFDALTPLMKGGDMDKLEEMKKQEMPDILYNRSEIYLMVDGDKLRMQLGMDQAGEIESPILTHAICENYLGSKPVSPALKKAVMKEMQKLAKRKL